MKIRLEVTKYPTWGYLGPWKEHKVMDVEEAISDGYINEDSDFNIEIPIIDAITNDEMLDRYHLNEWCVNEGLVDADDWIVVSVKDCIETGVINLPQKSYW